MSYRYYDIETALLPNIDALIPRFDPKKVKMGNIKDEFKKQQKIETERSNHVQKHKDRATLDPMMSYICAIGVSDDQDEYKAWITLCPDGEAAILKQFWDRLRNEGHTRLFNVGWNNHSFDLPFLTKRSWANGLAIPFDTWSERWPGRYHIDAMKHFCCHQYGEMCSLDRAAKFFGVSRERKHSITGENFWRELNANQDQALEYLKDDVLELRAIWERMQ